jgi:hypothetical protein
MAVLLWHTMKCKCSLDTPTCSERLCHGVVLVMGWSLSNGGRSLIPVSVTIEHIQCVVMGEEWHHMCAMGLPM